MIWITALPMIKVIKSTGTGTSDLRYYIFMIYSFVQSRKDDEDKLVPVFCKYLIVFDTIHRDIAAIHKDIAV